MSSSPVKQHEDPELPGPYITESTSLLNSKQQTPCEADPRTRGAVWSALTALMVAALVVLLFFQDSLPDGFAPWLGTLPKDPLLAALKILETAPVIDGHIDLPWLVRMRYANNISAIDLESTMPGHVDIPRLRQGFFWLGFPILLLKASSSTLEHRSVYVNCADPEAEGPEFLVPKCAFVLTCRDTLEQIDSARMSIEKYSDTFQLALGSSEIKSAIAEGKIASLIGVEGAHQLGNSIAVLRQYHSLGVRYMTLTHVCHNAFADSCGFYPGKKPLHGGLSTLGHALIDEMNRLGVLVDLSHTSDATAAQALNYSKAPVIWSHSSSRAVHDHVRNVPDDVLKLVGTGEGQSDAVIMVNFAPDFVADPGQATLQVVANHVEHIASITGKQHVGIGSDFDGIGSTPAGLEDVSTYPALVAELYRRGWNKYELAGFTGGNLLRIFEGAEKVSSQLKGSGMSPVYDIYDKRKDIPGK
ncbi:membrane dipeptidase-domain-containing protein [Armillaria borealis]|uniref:Dipeptidase n=1 Tax=Armillaria borealis TaxID=47425 RepID=A0AA39K7G8_9AGAR|nr:membrane dipeptidase-domain-containing protein [Armillaria borealis]